MVVNLEFYTHNNGKVLCLLCMGISYHTRKQNIIPMAYAKKTVNCFTLLVLPMASQRYQPQNSIFELETEEYC